MNKAKFVPVLGDAELPIGSEVCDISRRGYERPKTKPKANKSAKHRRQLENDTIQRIEADRVDRALEADCRRQQARIQRNAGRGRKARVWRASEAS